MFAAMIVSGFCVFVLLVINELARRQSNLRSARDEISGLAIANKELGRQLQSARNEVKDFSSESNELANKVKKLTQEYARLTRERDEAVAHAQKSSQVVYEAHQKLVDAEEKLSTIAFALKG